MGAIAPPRVLRGRLWPLPAIGHWQSSWKERTTIIWHSWVTSWSLWYHQYLDDDLKWSARHGRSKIPKELKIFPSLKIYSRFTNFPELPTSQMQTPPHLPDPSMIKISDISTFHRSITVYRPWPIEFSSLLIWAQMMTSSVQFLGYDSWRNESI